MNPDSRARARTRRLLLALSVTVLVAAFAFALRRVGEATRVSDPTAEHRGCYRCHAASEAPEGVHQALPCESCHLGDTSGTNVLSAHRGLEREPGALETLERTCGACHAEELNRVRSSMMTTARGLISVNRWALGETSSPDGDQSMAEVLALDAPSPAEDHLRRLCAGCHLGSRRENRDDAIADGGSGCSACHMRPAMEGGHPRVGGPVSSDACLGCHSRSTRISLSYQGLVEASGELVQGCVPVRELSDGRSLCAAPADVHSEAGLGCVDCHLHSEVMGDGTSHAHQEDAVELRCASCHGSEQSLETTWSEVSDPITERLLRLYDEPRPPTERVRTGARGTPLYNLRPNSDGDWELRRKSGDSAPLRVQQMRGEHHNIAGHERLECVACHARWAPRCPTCHTDFMPAEEQWDFGRGHASSGRFRERSDGVGFGPPALGVRNDGRIMPAIPGMVGTVDLRAAGGERVALRLYSLIDPHTTGSRARTCLGCHTRPWALGLGEGRLEADGDSQRFIPAALSSSRSESRTEDGVAPWVSSARRGGLRNSTAISGSPRRRGRPRAGSQPTGALLDRELSNASESVVSSAWTTLDAVRPGVGTRHGARSLNHDELERVMRVGACLVCHDGTWALYRDFDAAWRRLERGEAPTCELSVRR